MVRKFKDFVNRRFFYIPNSKGITQPANPGEKSGHPQVHEIGSGGFREKIQI